MHSDCLCHCTMMRCCKVGCCLHNHGGLFSPDMGSGEHHVCSSCLFSFVAWKKFSCAAEGCSSCSIVTIAILCTVKHQCSKFFCNRYRFVLYDELRAINTVLTTLLLNAGQVHNRTISRENFKERVKIVHVGRIRGKPAIFLHEQFRDSVAFPGDQWVP